MRQTADVKTMTAMLDKIFPTVQWDDSVELTAARVLRAWQEFSPKDMAFRVTTFPTTSKGIIAVRNISFSSMCAHHLFPVLGTADVAYIPMARMVGLSKIPRIVRHFAHQPTTQETMGEAIAKFIHDELQCMGVAVVIKATHTCMACRGVEAVGADMVTSVMKGVFLTAGEARNEFLMLTRRP